MTGLKDCDQPQRARLPRYVGMALLGLVCAVLTGSAAAGSSSGVGGWTRWLPEDREPVRSAAAGGQEGSGSANRRATLRFSPTYRLTHTLGWSGGRTG
jgi:hypothetical protein